MRYKVIGGADMTDTLLVRTHGVIGRRAVSALLSKAEQGGCEAVREVGATTNASSQT